MVPIGDKGGGVAKCPGVINEATSLRDMIVIITNVTEVRAMWNIWDLTPVEELIDITFCWNVIRKKSP